MANTIHVDVVSAEEQIFSGEAEFVVLPGIMGELGIYPRHTPLLTQIRPGALRRGNAEYYHVGRVILERRMPTTVTTKGQVTIPKKVREHLDIGPGSSVEFEAAPGVQRNIARNR